MANPHPQLSSPVFKTPAIFVLGLLLLQSIILVTSLEFPIEVFFALIGVCLLYMIFRNTFTGVCTIILMHFLVLRGSEGINIGEIFFALSFFGFLTYWFFKKFFLARTKVLANGTDYALAGFLVMCVFSIIPAIFNQISLLKWLRELLPFFTLLLIFPLREVANSTRRIKIILACFVLLALAVAIDNLLAYRQAASAVTQLWELKSSRKAFNAPMFTGIVIMASAFFVSVKTLKGRLFALLTIMVFTGALIITFTRGYWLATAIGILTLFLLISFRQKMRMGFYYSVFAMLFTGTIFLFFGELATFILDAVGERFSTVGAVGKDLSLLNRMAEAKYILLEIAKNPVVGYGLGKMFKFDAIIPYEFPTWYIHNTVLFVWYKVGFIGLLGLATFAVGTFRQGYRVFKTTTDPFTKTLISGLLACFVALVFVSFSSPQLLERDSALLIAMLSALAHAVWNWKAPLHGDHARISKQPPQA